MKRLALAAAGAALVGLTACSHSAPPSKADATRRTGTSTVPVSCSQQYRTWASGEGKDVMDALHSVSSAARTGRGKSLTAVLRRAEPAVGQATRHPMPACADPRGYWSVLLMHVHAAAAGEGSSSSARAALRDVPTIYHQLLVEVKQAAR